MREELDRGIEPDESYYIANESRMRFHDEIDLADDPPPDLVIEIDVSRSSVNKKSIYASLGVPEFWRWEDGKLQILALTPEREYKLVEASVNLPVLSRADVETWVQKRATMDETSWFLAILTWAQDELAPRLRDQAGK
jgi:Uma2 family endonuclease